MKQKRKRIARLIYTPELNNYSFPNLGFWAGSRSTHSLLSKIFMTRKKPSVFDAEYFQPKYEEIVEAVKKYKGGFDGLGTKVVYKDKNLW